LIANIPANRGAGKRVSSDIKISNSLSDDLHTLARACRILNMEGHADMTLGHLSLRDTLGRGLWLKRSGIGLGEVQGVGDFTLIDFADRKLAGSGRLHIKWPIHAAVLAAAKGDAPALIENFRGFYNRALDRHEQAI
jgi:hypothetical protein